MIEARFPARRTVMVSRGKSWYASDAFVCMLIHVPWVNINRMTQGWDLFNQNQNQHFSNIFLRAIVSQNNSSESRGS